MVAGAWREMEGNMILTNNKKCIQAAGLTHSSTKLGHGSCYPIGRDNVVLGSNPGGDGIFCIRPD
jgi:hypothetical protein